MTAEAYWEQVNAFLSWLRGARSLSPHTVEAYAQDLKQLGQSLLDQNKTTDPNRWTLEDLEQFTLQQRESGYELSTVVRRLACIRTFCRYGIREGWLSNHWADHLNSPKLWNRLPDVLSEQEVEKLLLASTSGKTPCRNKALIEMLYGSGLRVSELVNLRLSHLRSEDRLMLVKGKGDKERYVPIGDHAFASLNIYLKKERPQLLKKGEIHRAEIWLGLRGQALTRQSIYRILRDLGKLAGIQKNVYPHLLRHSYATHLLENGADLRVIQELLGHSDISTTERYTSVNTKSLKDRFRDLHPRG